MRPTMRPDNLTERIALRFNLAPVPVAEALFGQALARSVMAGVRLGVFASLGEQPASAEELAERLDLDPHGTRLLLEALRAGGHVDLAGERYRLSDTARRWLDPRNDDSYVGNFIENTFDFWHFWGGLEEYIRSGGRLD